MSKRTDREFLSDILEAIRRIRAYTAGMTFEAFMGDTKTQDIDRAPTTTLSQCLVTAA